MMEIDSCFVLCVLFFVACVACVVFCSDFADYTKKMRGARAVILRDSGWKWMKLDDA